MKGDRGYVLINALILVAALSVMAAALLHLSAGARERRGASQTHAQALLYLDGAEALAATVLNRDLARGSIDTLDESWAEPITNTQIDRGQISIRMADLQGRFNVNWLVDAQDVYIRAVFNRYAAEIGLPVSLAEKIALHVNPESGRGPVTMMQELLQIDGMTDARLDRFAPFLSVLPGDTPLNVNTAPDDLLIAYFPDLTVIALDRLRGSSPIPSAESFVNAVATTLGHDAVADIDELHFSVGSSWFAADMEALLQGAHLRRRVVLLRRGGQDGTLVAHRVTYQE